jgi:CRP/FNR family cyclic AMP-dependent transcriptional regulator
MTDQIEILKTLKSIPWFLELSQRQLETLAGISSLVEFNAGQTIFGEGDQLEHMYIILEGEVGVDMSVPSRGQVRIYVAEPLDIIGWSKMTPVVRQRTASVIALKTTHLLLIQGDELLALCDQDRQVGYIIFKRLANVVASNMLITKLQLLDRILHSSSELA